MDVAVVVGRLDVEDIVAAYGEGQAAATVVEVEGRRPSVNRLALGLNDAFQAGYFFFLLVEQEEQHRDDIRDKEDAHHVEADTQEQRGERLAVAQEVGEKGEAEDKQEHLSYPPEHILPEVEDMMPVDEVHDDAAQEQNHEAAAHEEGGVELAAPGGGRVEGIVDQNEHRGDDEDHGQKEKSAPPAGQKARQPYPLKSEKF